MKKTLKSGKKLELIKKSIVVLTGNQAMAILTGEDTKTKTQTGNDSLDPNGCSGLRPPSLTGGSL